MANENLKGVRLLNARTTDGTDGYVRYEGNNKAILQIEGTFNGANVTLQVLGGGGNNISVLNSAGTAFTATTTGTYVLDVVKGQDIRATIASAGGSTSLTAYLLSL